MPNVLPPEIDLAPETIRRFLDLGFRISFPGNMDPQMWAKTRPYRALIDEVYASLHHDVFPSARVLTDTLTPEQHLQHLLSLGRQLAADNVALNVVLNLQPLPWHVDEKILFEHLERLMDIAEVRVSISDFIWAHRLRNHYPDLRIDTSVIAKIDSSFKALYWNHHVDSCTVAVDRNINKKPHILRQIAEAGFTVKLVVSDGCMPSCPAEFNHWIAAAASSNEELGARFFHTDAFCRFIKERLPLWHMLKKEVLPFHLPMYEGAVHLVKLCDRMATTEENLRTLAFYVRMDSDIHPRYLYKESANSLDRLDHCDWNCHECHWCSRHMTALAPDPPEALQNHEKITVSDMIGSLFESIPKPSARVVSHAMSRVKDYVPDEERPMESEEAQTETASQEKQRPEQNDRDNDPDNLLTSIKRAKRQAESEGDDGFPALLATVLQTFRPFVLHGHDLPSGYNLTRLDRKNRLAVLLTWENGDSFFEIVLVPTMDNQPSAISGKRLNILFHLSERTDENHRQAFRENEKFLAKLIQ